VRVWVPTVVEYFFDSGFILSPKTAYIDNVVPQRREKREDSTMNLCVPDDFLVQMFLVNVSLNLCSAWLSGTEERGQCSLFALFNS